jgi:hypothetical protein
VVERKISLSLATTEQQPFTPWSSRYTDISILAYFYFFYWLFNHTANIENTLMNVEQLVEWKLAGKTEEPGEQLARYHYVHTA